MNDRLEKIEKVLNTILLEESCSITTANWLEVELDEIFPDNGEIQDFVTELALYKPQGGEYLINEKEFIEKCRWMLRYFHKIKAKPIL